MKTFTEHLQGEVGCNYPLRTMIDNLFDEDIDDSIENYIKFRNKEVLKLAKENARFDSAQDKTGFIYITQLQELLKIEEI